MIADQRGGVALTVAVLMPLLLTTLCGVIQLGAVRVLAIRVASAADMATVAATDDQDGAELTRTGALRLAPDATLVARSYFAMNLAQIAPHLATSPESVAAQANVAAFPTAPAVDPLTGWRYDRPTVRLAADVPIRTLSFGIVLPAVTTVTVRSASAAR